MIHKELPLYRQKAKDALAKLGVTECLPQFLHEDLHGRRVPWATPDTVIAVQNQAEETRWYVEQARRQGVEFVRIHVRHEADCPFLKGPKKGKWVCTCADPQVLVEQRGSWQE